MKVGYARVSTTDQNLDMQLDALQAYGCEKIFSDKKTGKNTDREGLNEALEFIRNGDTLVVYKLDRLARSLNALIKLVNTIQDRGAEFISLNESVNTTTPGGKLIFHIFSSLAEFERSLIVERTKAGLEAARKRGRTGGRPRQIDQALLKDIRGMYKSGMSVKSISRRINVSIPTIYRYLKSEKS